MNNKSMSDPKTKPKIKSNDQSIQREPKNREDMNHKTSESRTRNTNHWTIESNNQLRHRSNGWLRLPSNTSHSLTNVSHQDMAFAFTHGYYRPFYGVPNTTPNPYMNPYPMPYPTAYPNPYFNNNSNLYPNTFPNTSMGYPNPCPTRVQSTTKDKMSQSLSEEEIREKVLKYRSFRSKECFNDKSKGFEFSIMTFNILSQNLLEDHSDLYRHCSPSTIEWPERGHRILRELLESNADIICLQEVHSKHFNELLMPSLKQNGYNFVYKRKTGDKLDGCAIVYREDMFSVTKTIKLELMRKDLSSLLDRDNIGLIVELRPKAPEVNPSLIVANTHLLYNPKRGDVKIAQIRLLLAEMDKLALIRQKDESYDYNPIILCGDLNSEPNSLLYEFITKGLANFDGLKVGDISGQKSGGGRGRSVEDYHLKLLGVTSDTRFECSSDDKSCSEELEKMSIKHNFKFKSIYERIKTSEKYISTSNRFDSGLVDYIFYDYRKLKLLGSQRLLTRKQMEEIGNIPNSYLGSDHLSLKAKFMIT